MIDTTLEVLEAEAKTRSLLKLATEKLNSFDEVGHYTSLTPEQDEIRQGLMGERETHLLCLRLLGEEIDRRDEGP